MGRWASTGVDLDGDQLMDVEDEVAHTLSGSGSEDDEDDSDKIKALKVQHYSLCANKSLL